MPADATPFEGWAILELMGHRRLAGLVTEQTIGGVAFLRLDVPAPGADAGVFTATQFYAPQSVYCLTPTTEAIARALAASAQPQPVTRYELPAPRRRDVDGDDDDDDLYEASR